MKEAYLVIDQKVEGLVSADDADYPDFRKIFQCPVCGETLSLAKYGGYIGNLFRHPKGDVNDCERRSDWNIDSKASSELDWIPRGQSRKKLEEAFLDFFKRCSRANIKPIFPDKKFASEFIVVPEDIGVYRGQYDSLKRYIAYNKKMQSHESPELLVKACARILADPRVDRFFLESIRVFQIKLINRQDSLEYFERHSQAEKNSIEELIRFHCKRVNGIARFLSKGSSEKLRTDFLDIIIWASSTLPVPYESIIDKKGKEQNDKIGIHDFIQSFTIDKKRLEDERIMRLESIQEINQFSTEMLSQIHSDSDYIEKAFRRFYSDKNDDSCKLIAFCLNRVFNCLKNFNWLLLAESQVFR